MKAVLFSIGEATTDLARWALERQGLEVTLVKDSRGLAEKIDEMVDKLDEDILRVDADIIVNKRIKQFIRMARLSELLWAQSMTFDWWKQDLAIGTPTYIKAELLPVLRKYKGVFADSQRPETDLTRIKELYEPRRFGTLDVLVGVHGWGQADVDRVEAIKRERGQLDDYDFSLARRMR